VRILIACAALYREGGRWYVYEAVQPVQLTPFSEWTKRGKDGHFVVKRLRDRKVLTPAALARMKTVAERYRGRDYDLYFSWSDDRIYCSELVWKIYQTATRLEIGKLQKLRDFDLSHPAVRQKMRERYGTKIPSAEPVISPSAMFDSGLLIEVVRRSLSSTIRSFPHCGNLDDYWAFRTPLIRRFAAMGREARVEGLRTEPPAGFSALTLPAIVP